MKNILLMVIVFSCSVPCAVSAADEKVFFDRSVWKVMTEREKIVYLDGLITGMSMGAYIPTMGDIKTGDASLKDIATYIDYFYEDMRNMHVAVPFTIFVFAGELHGQSKETIEAIIRVMRGKTQIETVHWFKEISDEILKDSISTQSPYIDREILNEPLNNH